MEPQSGIKTWQWVVTVIVIVILIVVGVMVFGKKGAPEPTANINQTPSSSQPPSSPNRIVMTDQYPGNVVFLNSVQLDKEGWVAIHKDNNGQPGDIIGSAHFDSGINTGRITVTQPIIDGAIYYAMVHSSDGNATFDATKDLPLKDSGGSVIMHVFHGSSSVSSELKG